MLMRDFGPKPYSTQENLPHDVRRLRNYIGTIRGKGIERPRTLANLRLPQHLAPPSQGQPFFC